MNQVVELCMRQAVVMVGSQEDQDTLKEIQGTLRSEEHGIGDMLDHRITLLSHRLQASNRSYCSDHLH